MQTPYRSYAPHLEGLYGGRVYRVGVDALFSCPNRRKDGTGGCAFCDGRGASAVYHRTQEHELSRLGLCRDGLAEDFYEDAGSLPERIDRIRIQIERGKAFVKRRYKAERYSLYFQSYTNTFDTMENLKALFDAALACGPFVEFIVSTRPDCLPQQVVGCWHRMSARSRKSGLRSGWRVQISAVWTSWAEIMTRNVIFVR